ncbi:phosphoribosyl-ATP pyrophosphatase, partial [candidate division MSBL1 archaeon SCGC-AAA261F19]
MDTEILDEVFEVIKDRRGNPREQSYVSRLLKEGEKAVVEKVREESEELIEAAEGGERSEIIHEAADTIFHVMVLLAAKGVEFEDVMKEL